MLSIYQYKFKYRPAKHNSPADAMSRLPLSIGTQVESINNLADVTDLPISVEKVREQTKHDIFLSKIINFVKSNWPVKIPFDLKNWYHIRKSLYTDNDCIYYRDRLVKTVILRNEVLTMLHANHGGIVRLKMLARRSVWWPKLDECIEKYISNCLSCQSTQKIRKEKVISKWPRTILPKSPHRFVSFRL